MIVIHGKLTPKSTVTTTENHNQSKHSVMELIPNGYIYKIILYLILKEHCEEVAKKVVRVRGSEIVL